MQQDKIPARLKHCLSVRDVQKVALKSLPWSIREYIEGGGDDEKTLRENSRGFDDYTLMTDMGTGQETADTQTVILGQPSASPILLSPWGVHQLMHKDGERATAKAAMQTGCIYSMSNFSTTSIEDVAHISDAAKFFQLQPARDKAIMLEQMQRAKAAGYKALIVTIDNPIHGNRERDHRSGFGLPPTFPMRSLLSLMAHPKWVFNYLRNKPNFANFSRYFADGKDHMWLFHNLVTPITWDTLQFVRDNWDAPMAVKGIMSSKNAKQAVSIGCDGVIVSNQGGRNFDGITSTIAALEEVVDAISGQADIILDGGIRRGSDVVKALALGATACSTARPFVYGLSAAGQQGVEYVINLLRAEVERAMVVSGAKDIASINADMLRR
ncbi:alpha-hydroxy-acid oxidizing protein [Thalassotalea sp. HSM 43]|uniref:alpha-hydroxy acid oxidase n=1 Tax=Thalassotalea sp. HSM 43 TaxID=2552945 RepID=UPI0010806E5F|nr:alpha-hydroxy acid oxidase [Thalassotalea sp. HSM 43]QBY03303.1 alpha-hydroxy-acid oxidizing protein [Thalassotalea sp. HSM 43]